MDSSANTRSMPCLSYQRNRQREKKLAISEFIRDEHGIRVVDAVQELLKNKFIEAIDENYILKLKQGIHE